MTLLTWSLVICLKKLTPAFTTKSQNLIDVIKIFRSRGGINWKLLLAIYYWNGLMYLLQEGNQFCLFLWLLGIAFEFLDDGPYWLHCVLKLNKSYSYNYLCFSFCHNTFPISKSVFIIMDWNITSTNNISLMLIIHCSSWINVSSCCGCFLLL